MPATDSSSWENGSLYIVTQIESLSLFWLFLLDESSLMFSIFLNFLLLIWCNSSFMFCQSCGNINLIVVLIFISGLLVFWSKLRLERSELYAEAFLNWWDLRHIFIKFKLIEYTLQKISILPYIKHLNKAILWMKNKHIHLQMLVRFIIHI